MAACFRQRFEPAVVLLFGERQVDVIRRLAVTAPAVGNVHVDRIGLDDWRCGVVETQEVAADAPFYGLGQCVTGQRTRGEDDDALGNVRQFTPVNGNERVCLDLLGHLG